MKGKMNKELIRKVQSDPSMVSQLANELGISEWEVADMVNQLDKEPLSEADQLLRSSIEAKQKQEVS